MVRTDQLHELDRRQRERLRSAMSSESTIDLSEHEDRVVELLDRVRRRYLPTEDLFQAVRERSS